MTPERRRGPGGESEASSNITNIAGGDSTNGTVSEPVHGGDIASDTAPVVDLAELVTLIEQRSAGGRIVCACSLYPLDHLGELATPNVVGGAFRVAALHGLIEPLGHHKAIRRARQSGVHAIWRGRVVA